MKSPGIVFHTSVAPHVRETVRAFERAGRLAGFHTTLYDGRFPLGPWTGMLPERRKARLQQRRIPGLDSGKVHTFPWWEILRLAIPGPATFRESLADSVWEKADHAFARHVATQLPPDCGFVYGYDHSSLEVFAAARARGIRCLYELNSPEWGEMQELTRAEMEKVGHGNDPYLGLCERRLPRRIRRCRQEWDLADVVVVNSNVTRDSFAAAGYAMDKVRVVPLGAPVPDPAALRDWKPDAARIRLIWVGPFMPRKGARILREALASADWPANAHIDIYGSVPMAGLQSGFPPGRVDWHGPVTQAEVRHAMARADALLLPTLADGFGMAITEAWSCGLPVLTTPRAGAAEWMTDHLHGIRFAAGSPGALVDAVKRFMEKQNEWPRWRAACQDLAASLSWEQYHRRLAGAVADSGVSDTPPGRT